MKIFGGAKGSDEREFEAAEICCRCGDRRVLILVALGGGWWGYWSLEPGACINGIYR